MREGDPDAIELAFLRTGDPLSNYSPRVLGAVPGDFTVELLSLGEDVSVQSLGWSFDGQHLAVGRGLPELDVVVLSIASQETTVFAGMREPSWSPVAQEFLALRDDGDEQVLVDFESGSARVVGPECRAVSWAPDGQRWACVDFENALQIVDRATATATVVPLDVPVDEAAWSPTADVIACVARDPTSWDYTSIISVTPDGQDVRRWDHNEVALFFNTPVWSPDGRQLAVSAQRPDANDPSEFFVSIFDAGTATAVERLDATSSVAWARDGRRATTSFVGTGSLLDVGSRIGVIDDESEWFSAGPETTLFDGSATWRPP